MHYPILYIGCQGENIACTKGLKSKRIPKPPLGFNLFYMRAIAPADCTMAEIYASVWPWVICEAIVLMLVMFFPIIGMWLPNRMG